MTADPQAGPELDGRIAVEVFGACYRPRFASDVSGYYDFPAWLPRWTQPQTVISEELPAYSTDMGAAGHVLAYMVGHGSSVDLNWGEDTDAWECSWITSGDRSTGFAGKEQPALAICRAALKATKARDHSE